MIVVRLTEAELVEHNACQEGLDLFREIGGGQTVEVEWTPFASVWLAVGSPYFCGWLREQCLIPIADLRSADLRSADLRSADLRSADLRSANLRDADLRDADLRGADLRSADLRSADLRCANLRGADLYGADLYGADLYGADLRGAVRNSTDPAIPGWSVAEGRLVMALQALGDAAKALR